MADKEEIRDRNDIVEVIGSYVPLKHKGRNWTGLCPFHQEKTPSFAVDPITKTFRCWGCGQSGDVFTFIERYENMSFVEAAEFLARRVGVTLDRLGGGAEAAHEKSEREQLYEANGHALAFFREMFTRSDLARGYIYEKRAMAHEMVERFQIGYAPESWDALTTYLQRKRLDLRIAAKAGLVHLRDSGGYYDAFRNRVLFPILDEQERIVGFGGRTFGDEQPKYLNTGETPIFAKSKLLYGLPQARKKIGAEGKTLLMEGYMDVIAAHQAGFTNAVATLGTSLTEEHGKKLARLADTVVLVYDGDNAGIKATLRASEILEAQNVAVRVVRLPAGDDPDSLLKRGEIARFQQAIDQAAGRVQYQLERIVATADQSTPEGRAKMLRQMVHILASLPSRTERDAYMDQVAPHHPLAGRNFAQAVESLHRDAEAVQRKQRGEAAPAPAEAAPAAPAAYSGRRGDYPRRDGAKRPYQGGGEGGQRKPWNGERRGRFDDGERRGPIEPPPLATDYPTAEQRAERELMRALAEPRWRAAVLKRISEQELLGLLARRFYAFVRDHPDALTAEEEVLVRMLDEAGDDDFSMAIKQQLQEFHSLMANVPLSEDLIVQCAATLRRYGIRLAKEEKVRILQGKLDGTREEHEELQRLLIELKSLS